MTDKEHLHILWTSGDPLTAQHMVMMYASNSLINNWWDEVTVIVWGAAAKLAAENKTVQSQIEMARHVGVKFSACIACARQLDVLKELEALNMEIIPWGEPLTELIKQEQKLITI